MSQASIVQAETQSDFTGCFVWHELASPDPEAAIKFYGRVLGWTATPVPEMSYTVMNADGQEVAGIRSAFPQEPQAWGGYIGTKDVDGIAKRIAQSGGTICREPGDIPGIGRFAVALDPFGAAFNLFNPIPKETPDQRQPGMPGHVGWNELRAGEWQRAFAFYADLFGWTKDRAVDMGPMGTYQIFAIHGVPSGGMLTIGACGMNLSPSWMFYWNVKDVDDSVRTLKEAGGEVTQGPMQVPGGSWIVQARDPQNVAFALVQPANSAP